MAEEMDPCECLWNNEMMVRRLISALRQGQSFCTDSECLDRLPSLPAPESAGQSFLVLFLTLALAVAMYVMRPRRRAQIQDVTNKPSISGQDDRDDGSSPQPPRL